MAFDTAEFLKGIMSDVALKEAHIRELGVEAGRLEAQIIELRSERDKVKLETAQAIQECCSHADQYKQETEQARLELEAVVSQVEAQRALIKTEWDAHKGKVASVKGEYAVAVKAVKDEIASLVTKRDGIKADITALKQKWS